MDPPLDDEPDDDEPDDESLEDEADESDAELLEALEDAALLDPELRLTSESSVNDDRRQSPGSSEAVPSARANNSTIAASPLFPGCRPSLLSTPGYSATLPQSTTVTLSYN